MRVFTNRFTAGYDRLSIEAKIVYTAFCSFALLGYGSAVWLYLDDDLGVSAREARAYYLGPDDVADPSPRADDKEPGGLGGAGSLGGAVEGGGSAAGGAAAGAGPKLELPLMPADRHDLAREGGADAPQARLAAPGAGWRFEKPLRQVVETLHFHLLSMPIFLLVIGHLYMMCRQRTLTKVVMLVVFNVTTLLHMVLPLAIRVRVPGVAAMMFPTAVLMTLTWTVMTVWPIVDMWRTPAFRTTGDLPG